MGTAEPSDFAATTRSSFCADRQREKTAERAASAGNGDDKNAEERREESASKERIWNRREKGDEEKNGYGRCGGQKCPSKPHKATRGEGASKEDADGEIRQAKERSAFNCNLKVIAQLGSPGGSLRHHEPQGCEQ